MVHVLNPGEREYLSPNLIGVQNIAMTFLPLSMNFVNIIDAYREIVNGVQYEILLNAVDTKAKDADTICRLVILEKPWLTTQWGDKHRELVNSNCSDVADNALSPESEDRSKALNDKYVSNSIFNGGRRNELSDSEMARLESQILTTSPGKRRVSSISSSPSSSTSSSITSTSTTTTSSIVPQAEPTNESTTSISVDEAATVPFESDVYDGITPTPTAELNDNEKRWLDDFLSVGAYNFEKTIEQQRLELKQQQQQQEQQQQHQEQESEKQQQEQEQVQDREEASSS